MGNVDWKAVSRRLEFIEGSVRETREMIDMAERGDYSPLMDYELFQEIADVAFKQIGTSRGQFCMIDGPHRCSRCEWLVRNFMNREANAA